MIVDAVAIGRERIGNHLHGAEQTALERRADVQGITQQLAHSISGNHALGHFVAVRIRHGTVEGRSVVENSGVEIDL